MLRPLFGAEPVGPVLSTRRLLLRMAENGDYEQWADLRERSRSFLKPWEPTWPSDCLSRRAFRARVRQALVDAREDTAYAFLIFRRQDGALLGGVTIGHMRRGAAQSASIGYWIGVEHARQGYMAEALSVVLKFSFESLKLNRVEAACLPHNTASRRLLEKVGFVEEGLARDYFRIDGAWQDHILYAFLERDRYAQGQPAATAGAAKEEA